MAGKLVAQAQAALEALGFSAYEAQAYIALTREKSATGYRISKISGVPRSRVYETLERLTAKGFAVTLPAETAGRRESSARRSSRAAVQEGSVEYAPVPLKELVGRLKGDFDRTLAVLESEIHRVTSGSLPAGVWNLQGREAILNRALEMIEGAKKSVCLVAWASTIERLQKALEKTGKGGARIIVISCGAVGKVPGIHYRHSFEAHTVCQDDSSINLVVDGEQALVGETSPEDLCRAAWSRNTGLVSITEEYVRHEVYLHKIIQGLEGREAEVVARAFTEGLAEVPHHQKGPACR